MQTAWKLVTVVLSNAFSFDCCVVPPDALASYAQELDEIVDALIPMFVGQDRLEHVSIKRMCLPRNAGGFDVTRSPMAFLAQYLASVPSVAKSTGLQAMEILDLVEAAIDAQEQLKHMGLSMDERGMPRKLPMLGPAPLRKGQTSWKQPLVERRQHGVNPGSTLRGPRRTEAQNQNVPHWTTWNSASTQGYDWTSL